jgi:hypothetical protein
MKAPENIPYSMFTKYGMGGDAKVEYAYRNDCGEETQQLINANFTEEIFNQSVERIKNKEQNYYGMTDTWMYEALEKYPVEGKHVVIFGSTHPWYEAMAITHGASKCTVIEYSKRESFHEKIEYIQPHEVGNKKYDISFSISSFEHDGLGRYGDPLDPDGDLKAMENAKSIIHKDGLMLLSIPSGYDKVVFNLHRVYGEKRTPMLLSKWEKIDLFGEHPNMFSNDANGVNGSPYQPVYVVRNV